MSLVPFSQVATSSPKRARVEERENRFKRLSAPLFNYVHTFLCPMERASVLPTCKRLRENAEAIWRMSLHGIRKVADYRTSLSSHYHFANGIGCAMGWATNYTELTDEMHSLRSLYLRVRYTLSTPVSMERQSQIDYPRDWRGLVADWEERAHAGFRQAVVDILASTRIKQLTSLSIISDKQDLGLSDTLARRITTGCPELEELTLMEARHAIDPHVTDAGLAGLGALTKLRSVRFECCHGLTKKTAVVLAKMTSLTSADLRGCKGIKHESVDILLDSPSLRRLGAGDYWHDQFERESLTRRILQKGGELTHLFVGTELGKEVLIEIVNACGKLIHLDISDIYQYSRSQKDNFVSDIRWSLRNRELEIVEPCFNEYEPPRELEYHSDDDEGC